MLTPQHGRVVDASSACSATPTEELRVILAPMARTGAEPLGSMGTDTAIAVLSDRSRLLYDYFTQLFAQVTNPPLDAIREELVTSLSATIGPEANLLEATAGLVPPDRPAPAGHRPRRPGQAACTSTRTARRPGFKAFAIDGLFEVREAGTPAPTAAGGERCAGPSRTCGAGSPRPSPRAPTSSSCPTATRPPSWAPIPSLLLTAAVHHHLVREKTRTKVGLVVETGDAREVHHMALLIGYGAAAVNPYLALESIDDMIAEGLLDGRHAPPGPAQLHQGGLQGRPQGDVQDGHLDRGLLHRRPGLRGDRPRPRR